MPKPGDIIQKAKILLRDPRGRYWFKSRSSKGYIPSNYIQKDDIEKDDNGERIVKKIVCILKEQFGLRNYESRLCQHFYRKGGKMSGDNFDAWFPRWLQAAAEPAIVRCEYPQKLESLPIAPHDKKWRFLYNENWVMPVFTSAYSDVLHGQDAFCPSPLDKMPPLPPVYNGNIYGNPSDGFAPLTFHGKLTGGLLKQAIPVTTHLHGALNPLKWHTDIRRHVLSGTLDANKKETQLWKAWLKEDLPDKSQVKKIFTGCQYHLGKGEQPGMCAPCNPEHFRKVHGKISTLSQLYWKKAVTFWASGATKLVEQESNPNGVTDLTVKVFAKQSLNINGKNIIRYPLLVLKGWCYEDLCKNPENVTLHLNVLTFYFKNASPAGNVNTVLPGMEIKNVSRI